MSKIIETLKTGVMEFRKKEADLADGSQKKKTDHELTQEQLADIYFAGSEKIKKSDTPTVIKVVEKSRSLLLAPWLIALAALLIASFSLYSGKRIFIDVKIMNERAAALTSPESISETDPEAVGKPAQGLRLGDKLSLESFYFEGAAKLKSSQDRSGLTLVNSSVAPFARAVFRFDSPVNLTGSKIVFYAKGIRGGENVAFALKDKGNVSAFNKNKLYPYSNALTTDWQRAEIPLFSVVKGFDVKNVSSLRFEFGSKDTDNKPGDTIMVRDIQAVPL